jgi:hypothetical protein
MLELQNVTRKKWEAALIHRDLHKTNTKWLVQVGALLVLDEPRATRTHKTHHGPDLGEANTFPLIVYSAPLHGGHIQMAFCPMTLMWESRNSHNWDSHDFEGT